ncbi:hypothetical protein [Thauera sp. WH-1]|uniref:hypothetical protein n=1 Tax=Thauera sp. WH-1 TaxID=3398230 RepID=UPI0039FD70E6
MKSCAIAALAAADNASAASTVRALFPYLVFMVIPSVDCFDQQSAILHPVPPGVMPGVLAEEVDKL